MRNNSSLTFALILIFGDFLAIVGAFGLAYIVRFRVFDAVNLAGIGGKTFVYALVSILPLWLLIHAIIGLYSHAVYEKRFTEISRLLTGAFIGTLLVISANFVSPEAFIPGKLVPLYGFGLSFISLVLFRQLARVLRTTMFSYNRGINHVLFVGNNPVTEELISYLHNWKKSGYKVVGVVSDQPRPASIPASVPFFETFEVAGEKIGLDTLDSIMQTELYASNARNNQILTTAQQHHIAYRFVPGNAELFVGNIDVELFRSVPVIAVHQTALLGWGRAAKRIFDLVFAYIALVVLSPLMALIALCIKLSDSGPVLLRQTRLTRFNQPFTVYKFRTHHIAYNGLSPEEAFTKMGKPELIAKYRANGDQLQSDPRVTSIGKFLRITSLDELPQLINIVRGDISIVGPRALVPEELSAYQKKHTILSVKSGLTGLAQVSGRKDISFEERRKLDIYYVQNWSFWLDITIILKTIRAVLGGRGAM